MMIRTLSVTLLLSCLVKVCHSQSGVCGQASLNTRIVGGQDAVPNSWPWQVAIYADDKLCGGSLINSRWILSAAHCFEGKNSTQVFVVLGKNTLADVPSSDWRSVAQIFQHPQYNNSTYNNDISLLQLTSVVNLTSQISPVCLAEASSTINNGTMSWVTGWGMINQSVALPDPKKLQEVNVPIVGNRQCNCLYGVGSITDNMICAGYLAGGKDSCQGDSGGPLVIKQDSVWIQVGVVSFGHGCAQPKFPGIYTRVSQYESWIKETIPQNQPGFITFKSSGTDGDLSVSCDGLPPVPTAGNTTSSTTTAAVSQTNASIATTISQTTTTAAVSQTNASTATTISQTTTTAAVFPSTVSSTTAVITTTLAPTTLSPQAVCGSARLNTRVGDSSLASAGMWPWMASVQRGGAHVCGGTLISEQYVMSSASCFSSSTNASEWTVVLGRLKQNGSNPNEISVQVSNITLSNSTGNNVAVLQLAGKPTLSDFIQPICVDLGSSNFTLSSQCWVAGWGTAGGVEGILQELQTSVVDCGNLSSSNSICTQAMQLEQGDEGGPLMCKIGQSWIQAAVLTVPRGTNSTSTKQSTQASDIQVFTRTAAFSVFLQKIVDFFPPESTTSQIMATTSSAQPSSLSSLASLLTLTFFALLRMI